jgi:hypothetical protein
MLDHWHARATTTEPIDAMTEMSALTLGIVGRTLFGIDLSAEAADVGRAMLEALDFVNHGATHLITVPLTVPTPRGDAKLPRETAKNLPSWIERGLSFTPLLARATH